jgi:hypothetical protein
MLGQATCNTDSLDSPWPRLEGSHHLPPYNILCVSPRHLHPNGFLSRDSQGGVSKLSRFELPPLCGLITLCLNLGLGWGLKQTCSFRQELSNCVSHFTCTHRGRVDYRLLMVGSQIASLTPGLSFDHNLCCRCPNGSYKVIFDTYSSRPFQRYKEHLKTRRFDPCNWALKFWESRKTISSHFWECESYPHTCPKVGLQQVLSNYSISLTWLFNILNVVRSNFLCNIFIIWSSAKNSDAQEGVTLL